MSCGPLQCWGLALSLRPWLHRHGHPRRAPTGMLRLGADFRRFIASPFSR